MATTQSSRYATLAARQPAQVPFRRAGSAYTTALAGKGDPLDAYAEEITARFDVSQHGKPVGATIGRDLGRLPARRAGFRTPPR